VSVPATTPKSLAQRALQDFRQGRFADAAEGFRASREGYEQAGDLPAAAEAANNQSVALLQAGRPQEARRAVEGTLDVFERVGDSARAAQAVGNLASAAEACGDLEAAEQFYQAAVERFAVLGDSAAQATVLNSLSQLQLKRGRPLEALTTMQAGLEHKPRRSLRDRWLQGLLRIPSRLLRG
jgi:tetratricopeptide (TPR) repeat protein